MLHPSVGVSPGGGAFGAMGRLYGSRHLLYVKNLSPLVTEEHLRIIFENCSPVLRVDFKNLPGGGRYCEIEFKDSAGITAASQLNGTDLMGLSMQISVLDPAASLPGSSPAGSSLGVANPPSVIPPPSLSLSGVSTATAGASVSPAGLPGASPGLALPQLLAAAQTHAGITATPVSAVEIAMQNHLANLQAVQAAAQQAKQLAARKKSELGLGVAVTPVDGKLPPAQSLVSGILNSEPELEQLFKTCFVQGFAEDLEEKEVEMLMRGLGSVVKMRVGSKTDGTRYALVEFASKQEAQVVKGMDGKSIGSTVLLVRASDSLVDFRDPDGVLFDVPAPPILAAVKQQQQALLSPDQQREKLAQRQEKIEGAKSRIQARLARAAAAGAASLKAVVEKELSERQRRESRSVSRARDAKSRESSHDAGRRRRRSFSEGSRRARSRSSGAPSRSVSPESSPPPSKRARPAEEERGSLRGFDEKSDEKGTSTQRPLLRVPGVEKAASTTLKERLRRAQSKSPQSRDPSPQRKRSSSVSRRRDSPTAASPPRCGDKSRREESVEAKRPPSVSSLSRKRNSPSATRKTRRASRSVSVRSAASRSPRRETSQGRLSSFVGPVKQNDISERGRSFSPRGEGGGRRMTRGSMSDSRERRSALDSREEGRRSSSRDRDSRPRRRDREGPIGPASPSKERAGVGAGGRDYSFSQRRRRRPSFDPSVSPAASSPRGSSRERSLRKRVSPPSRGGRSRMESKRNDSLSPDSRGRRRSQSGSAFRRDASFQTSRSSPLSRRGGQARRAVDKEGASSSFASTNNRDIGGGASPPSRRRNSRDARGSFSPPPSSSGGSRRYCSPGGAGSSSSSYFYQTGRRYPPQHWQSASSSNNGIGGRGLSPGHSSSSARKGGVSSFPRGRSNSLHFASLSPPRRGELRSWRKSDSRSRSPPLRRDFRRGGGSSGGGRGRGGAELGRSQRTLSSQGSAASRDEGLMRRPPPPLARPAPSPGPTVERYKSQSRPVCAPLPHRSSSEDESGRGVNRTSSEAARRGDAPLKEGEAKSDRSLSPRPSEEDGKTIPIESRVVDLRRRLQSKLAERGSSGGREVRE